jgi:predicted nucleic acid-binding protein
MDASVAIAGLAPDEKHGEAVGLVDRAIVEGAVAPALFAYEIANILDAKRRRGAISLQMRDDLAAAIVDMDVELDSPTVVAMLGPVAALAARHRLTAYDAAYLDLAKRTGLPLATLDKDLGDSARREGLDVLGIG